MDVKKAAKEALGGKGKRLSPREIHIQRTQNKGYIARHMMADKKGNPPTDGQSHERMYGLANHTELLKHLSEHFGPEDEEAGETAPDDEMEETDEYPEAGPGPRPVLQKGA